MPTIPFFLAALLVSGCQSVQHAPLALAPRVDLARFMGNWYLIANIPTVSRIRKVPQRWDVQAAPSKDPT